MPTLAIRGFTLIEAIVTLVVVAVVLATFLPMITKVGSDGLRTVSLKNLVVLGEAHACYGADWNERQFSLSPSDFGTVNGNCSTYLSTVTCPPTAMLGWDYDSGALWGYFLGGGLCASSPGNCSNMVAYTPFSFTGTNYGFGGFRLPNLRGFQEYVGEKYYEREWFSELDSVTWETASQYFPLPDQFTFENDAYVYAAYCASPAALFHPDVLRAPSNGGYQNPQSGFADAFDSPAATMCMYPDLKTRMVEHSWLVRPPGPTNPNFAGEEPYYFNHGIGSKPGCLFFDGSVAEMTMKQAVADDEAVQRSSKGDGLWSRDTPLGADGYFGAQAFDDTRNSFHILTTGGITGRDFLQRGARP